MARLELISAHVRALREGDDATKTEAARALRNLASGVPDPWRANRVAIANAGGIAPLVELLRDGSAEAKAQAAEALAVLMFNVDNRALIAEAGGIPLLVELLRDGTVGAKWSAAFALGKLAYDNAEGSGLAQELGTFVSNEANQDLIAEAGAIPLLVQLLRDDGNWEAQGAARGTLLLLVHDNDANAVAVAVAIGLEAIVELARSGHVKIHDVSLVLNAGIPAKRKAALVVAQLIEATAPRTRVSRYIKAAIVSFL